MSSLISDVETMTAKKTDTKHKRLAAWVKDVAELCKPDQVHWCDGSHEEYQATCAADGTDRDGYPIGRRQAAQ